MSSRDDILNNIKLCASSQQPFILPERDWDEQVLSPVEVNLSDYFKSQLEKANGIFYRINNAEPEPAQIQSILNEHQITDYKCLHPDFKESLNFAGDASNAVVISCEALIAYSGSVLVSSFMHERSTYVFPENIVVIATEKQIVPYIKEGIELIQHTYKGNLPSLISLISGPSRTADIEKTLVMGAHGAKKLIVILRSGIKN